MGRGIARMVLIAITSGLRRRTQHMFVVVLRQHMGDVEHDEDQQRAIIQWGNRPPRSGAGTSMSY